MAALPDYRGRELARRLDHAAQQLRVGRSGGGRQPTKASDRTAPTTCSATFASGAANFGPGGGWVIGGSWEDPEYSYSFAAPMALLERSRFNGFRLMQDTDDPRTPRLCARRSTLSPRSRGLPRCSRYRTRCMRPTRASSPTGPVR